MHVPPLGGDHLLSLPAAFGPLATGAHDLPSPAEVLVVNPESPDAPQHLAAVAQHPHMRILEIAVGEAMATNKGAMINLALDAATGEWIWITDADCLFRTRLRGKSARIERRTGETPVVLRTALSSQAQTDGLLSGRPTRARLQHLRRLRRPST
jgi:hypothetical protein